MEYVPDALEYYDSYFILFISHSRRGQAYYLLAGKDSLLISVIATKPDGDGCEVALPDVLVTMIKNGDVF